MHLQRRHQFFFISFVLFSIVATSSAAPTHYDQRQDGKFNLHANLENFVIIIAPISDVPSSTSQEPDPAEFSLSGLLDAFEFRKNLIANSKLEHKNNKKKNIEAIIEVSQNEPIIEEDDPKVTRSLKTKPDKKKVLPRVTELALVGESIENCGPGRIRDRSGICQFDGSMKN